MACSLLGCCLVGCAGGPQAGSGNGLFSQTSLEQRRSSAAQTPIAQSRAVEAEKRRLTEGNPQTTSAGNGIALAAFHGGTPQGQSPPGSSPESFSVPREPIGMAPQYVDPTAPASGSPYHLAGHIRSRIGGHAHAAGNCEHCASGRPYRPVFPQMNGPGNDACGPGVAVPCGPNCGPECVPTQRCMDPQEYIYDGGDRDPAVRLREDLSQTGLDPEDTVIQYTTADGKTQVQSGCRVAIYAPRFGSVRKRTGTLTADLALRPQTNILPDGPGVLRERLPPVNIMQPVAPINKDTVRVVEAFRDRQRPMPAEWVLPMGVLSDAFKPYEDLDIIRNGDIRATDPAKLAMAAAAARTWTNVDQLQVIVDGQEAALVTDLKRAQEVLTYEFKGARIRLCKVASEQMANPGDVISFTIRFDNVGEQPLKNLVVTDSLAPRLEYVGSSQQASLPANFSTTPNEAGSEVLRWEFENPIKPGEGGLVRFDAKVR